MKEKKKNQEMVLEFLRLNSESVEEICSLLHIANNLQCEELSVFSIVDLFDDKFDLCDLSNNIKYALGKRILEKVVFLLNEQYSIDSKVNYLDNLYGIYVNGQNVQFDISLFENNAVNDVLSSFILPFIKFNKLGGM